MRWPQIFNQEENYMKNASQLLKDHLRYISSDPKKWVTLFAANADIEVPHTSLCLENLKLKNVQIYPQADSSISADYEVEARIKSTGEVFNQRYISFLKAEGGKITFLKEKTNNTIY